MSRRRGTRNPEWAAPHHTLRVVCDNEHRPEELRRYKVPKDPAVRRRKMGEPGITGTDYGDDWYGAPRLLPLYGRDAPVDSSAWGEEYQPPGTPLGHVKVRWKCHVPGCPMDVTLSARNADRLADDYATAGMSLIHLPRLSATVGNSNSEW